MKHFPGILFILLSFTSCISEDSLKPVIPNHLINANSAKTWVKTGHIKNNKNLSPKLKELQTSYTFYSNGTFREQQLIHLGSSQGRKGHYNLNISDKSDTTLNLNYSTGLQRSFNIDYIDTKLLKLSGKSGLWILETLDPPRIK